MLSIKNPDNLLTVTMIPPQTQIKLTNIQTTNKLLEITKKCT